MAQTGKPNTFFKGMQSDSDEALQPKETYRYAKNARVSSHDGDNISLQPYPSDRVVLNFSPEGSTFTTAQSITYTFNPILIDTETITIQDVYDYYNVDIFNIFSDTGNPYYPDFFSGIEITGQPSGFGGADDNQVLVNITIETENGTTYTMTSDIASVFVDADINGVSADIDTAIANQINYNDDIPISVTVTHSGTPGESNDACSWTFINTLDNSNAVTSFTVTSEVNSEVIPNLPTNNNYWMAFGEALGFTLYGQGFGPEPEGMADDFALEDPFPVDGQLFVELLSSADISQNDEGVDILNYSIIQTNVLINQYFQEVISSSEETFQLIQISEGEMASLGLSGDNVEPIQVLGTYGFSDYLVIFAKWPGLAAIQSQNGLPEASDMIIKVKQTPDGGFTGQGLYGVGNVNEELLVSDYSVYFVANLGFNIEKKIKIVGSEETGTTRRLYFTDGEFPLRTINVGLPSTIYSPYQLIPSYFDLFSPSVFSSIQVSGITDDGELTSQSYSYAFRYKTVDGRLSELSPFTNPASMPKTSLSTTGEQLEGGAYGENSGKAIKGIVRDVDPKYAKIQILTLPYNGNSPETVGTVFAELNIPTPSDSEDFVDVAWTHTGSSDSIIEEITISDISQNQVTWDTCRAMETKDNRLFCGNLSNSTTLIDTDFMVASYNHKNEHHSYADGNPHLYHDLLYSMGGIDFNNGGNEIKGGDVYSPYIDYEDNPLYRYIKGLGVEGDDYSAFYNGNTSRPIHGNTVSEDVPGSYATKRGIWGSQSRYFDELLPSDVDGGGFNEGVRVTFRVLDYESNVTYGEEDTTVDPLSMCRGKLMANGGEEVRTPVYKVSAEGVGGFSNTYANPVYNSNYVGYRRGEIYRFGILFYDKKGSPMFVKPIGDIRMPEHSAEYIRPMYDGNGGIFAYKHAWPYYFQTAIDPKDRGFVQATKPFISGDNYFDGTENYPGYDYSKGCVLYPHFEVKLSPSTTAQVGGYLIVRVPRDGNNKTILTSGILNRSIKYADTNEESHSNINNRLGNSTFSLFSELRQGEVGDGSGSEEENKLFKDSNVYTLDSPDAALDEDFLYSASSNDRIKFIESGFCQKQNVKRNQYGNTFNKEDYLSLGLAERYYNDTGEDEHIPGDNSDEYDGFKMQTNSLNQFAALFKYTRLDGTLSFVDADGNTQTAGGWQHFFSAINPGNSAFGSWSDGLADAMPSMSFSGDMDMNGQEDGGNHHYIGYFTKYYTKRISCYPQYGFAKHEIQDYWNNNHIGGYDSGGYNALAFDADAQQPTMNLPFLNLSRPIGEQSMPYPTEGDDGDVISSDAFFESNIKSGKVIGPGEELNLTGFEDSYKNGNMYYDLQTRGDYLFWREAGEDDIGDLETPGFGDNAMSPRQNASYTDGTKTIVLGIDEPGRLPIVRQNLMGGNWKESVHSEIGFNALNGESTEQYDRAKISPGGLWSPEVTIASIHRKKSGSTMYGGHQPGDFTRNVFQSTGAFSSVRVSPGDTNTSQWDVGENGIDVFGGDTYIGYYCNRKNESPDGIGVMISYAVPLECNFNINLRRGAYLGSSEDGISSSHSDEYKYNEAFDVENNAIPYSVKPEDFLEVNHFPSTVVWSEQKLPGEPEDSFSVFPMDNIKDLDYVKGPITQMFLLKNEMYALQHSGTAKLSINPRVLISSGEGVDIQTKSSSEVLERFDYVSESLGCQHFHGLAMSDSSAYYYDDNNSKFLRLGVAGKGKQQKSELISLGDAVGMQTYFSGFNNLVINDTPLSNILINSPASSEYDSNLIDAYNILEKEGGISIGYDPEYSEVLLTIMPEKEQPKTIIYNEKIGAFTSFVSKIPALYFDYKGRLYNVYNRQEGSSQEGASVLDSVYLSNGFERFPGNNSSVGEYLNFSGIDYYIWTNDNNSEEYKEPFEVEMVFNDSPIQSKLFDKIQLSVNTDTEAGHRYIYFRKFVFKGAANIDEITEFDPNDYDDDGFSLFANSDNIIGGATRTWYSVKDGFHFIPMRRMEALPGPQGKVRGNFSKARLIMGWGDEHPSGADINIKNEKFNIFSAVPFFRASRV